MSSPSVPPAASVFSFVRILALLALAGVAPLQPVAVANEFDDISENAGFVRNDYTYAQAWADLDGDGDRDLVVGTHFASPLVYENQGGGDFATRDSLFAANDHHGMVIADFDGDGDPDIFITAGASGGNGALGKSLYRNDGNFLFVNVATDVGLTDVLGRGRSGSAMDVDADGDVDLFVAKAARSNSANSLYVRDGDGVYQDLAGAAGVADGFGSEGGIWGDFDRDGDPDLLVSGTERAGSASRLYRNDGALAFTDVTATALPGIGQIAAAAWGDYDNDGDLDLAAGLGDEGISDGVQQSSPQDLAFFFNARSDENGVDTIQWTMKGDATEFDVQFQGDRAETLVAISSTGFQPEEMPFELENDAFGQPSYVPGQSIGIFIWVDQPTNTWNLECSTPPGVGSNFSGFLEADDDFLSIVTSNLEPAAFGPRGTVLYRNDGGVFTDVTQSAGISDAFNVRNVTWIDFDRDGDLDLHVHNKGDTESSNHPDVLYENQGGSFVDVTAQQRADGPTAGLGDSAVFEDFDDDGDPDLAITSGASPRFFALQETHRLFENRNDAGNFLRVNLEGTRSTRDGLGAWVTCVAPATGTQVRYVTGNAWRGSQVMMDPLFGLGSDSTVDLLRVEWPSGEVQELVGVAAGSVTLVEPSAPVSAPGVAGIESRGLLLAVSPNPSAGRVLFRIVGDLAGDGTLELVSVAGRRVFRRTVSAGGPGARVEWDGNDGSGNRAADGIYYAVLRDGARQVVEKVTLIR